MVIIFFINILITEQVLTMQREVSFSSLLGLEGFKLLYTCILCMDELLTCDHILNKSYRVLISSGICTAYYPVKV